MVYSEKPLKNVSIAIIGCGDIGGRIALLLQNSSYPVKGYTRNKATIAQLSKLGIGAKELDLDSLSNESRKTLRLFSEQVVFYFAPPPASGETDTRIRAWLEALDTSSLPRRILYISTTGVYGDHQGKHVNEKTPTNPQSDRAKRRLDAEQALADFARKHSVEYVILRVPGIYGENRLPRKRLMAQTPMLRPEVSPITNRIHEDDLATCCVTACLQSNSAEIYNVSDGDNMTMSDYFIQVAKHLNLPTPPRISWYEAETMLSASMLSYLKESRIVDNTKIINQLGITLKYPSLSSFLKL